MSIEFEKGIFYLLFDFKGFYVVFEDNVLLIVDFSVWFKFILLGVGCIIDFLLYGFEVVLLKFSIDVGNEVEFDLMFIMVKIEFLDCVMFGLVNIVVFNVVDIDFFIWVKDLIIGNL